MVRKGIGDPLSYGIIDILFQQMFNLHSAISNYLAFTLLCQ